MNFTLDRYLDKLYEDNTPSLPPPLFAPERWDVWRNTLKVVLAQRLGGRITDAPIVPAQMVDSVDKGSYTRQRWVVHQTAELTMPLYLLLPRQPTGQAVVAIHGHGYGVRDIVGLMPDGSERVGDPGYHKDFAVQLAQRGITVAAPELVGFGDRRLSEDADKPMEHWSCSRIATFLWMLGRNIASLRMWDVHLALEELLRQPGVDANRIGVYGISGGGLLTMLSAIFEDRYRAAVISGYTNFFRDSIMGVPHCVDNFTWELLRFAELPDLISLIAPRPLLIEAGTNDPIFPQQATKRAYERIGLAYQTLSARDKLDMDLFEGVHEISGAKSFDFLGKRL